MNVERTPVLVYNSELAAPHPVVAADVTLNGAADSVRAVLRMDSRERARTTWSGWPSGSRRRIAVAFDALDDPTGVYRYTMDVTAFSAGQAETTRAAGSLAIVNRSESFFGAGWWLAGLEQLILDPDGEPVFWVGGDGSIMRYIPDNISTPASWKPDQLLARPDSITRDGSGGYNRHLPEGLTVHFNSAGRHDRTTNRIGYVTEFSYSNDRLATIDLPLPQASTGITSRYAFSYTGSGYTVDAPQSAGSANARQVQITFNGGEVVSIVDPDNRSVSFESEPASARITARTDRRGTRTAFTYDNAQKLASSSTDMQGSGDDISVAITNRDAMSLVGPLDSASAFTLLDGPRTDVNDYTWIWLDGRQAPTQITDAVTNTTRFEREDTGYPALVTAVVYPNGYREEAVYDVRGNVFQIFQRNPYDRGPGDPTRDAVTTYFRALSSPFPDLLAYQQFPEGERVTYGRDSSSGNPLWMKPTGDDTRADTVRFTYNSDHQVVTVHYPAGSGMETLEYDSRGNLSATTTPEALRTEFHKDWLGRDERIEYPAEDSTHTRFLTYDAMDRVLVDREVGTYLSRTGWESHFVAETRTYDEEGNLLTSEAWATGGNSASDSTTTGINSWTYDRAHRAYQNVSPVDTTTLTFDRAGNVRTSTVRAMTTTMNYDALNRMTSRAVPGRSYARQTEIYDWDFPAFDDPFSIPYDSASFAYDWRGNLEQADNEYAKIRRTYFSGGALNADSISIRNYGNSTFGNYDFKLSLEYDRNGRRTAVHHPANLNTGATQYTYGSLTGFLSQVTDPAAKVYGFTYDANGQALTRTFPAGSDSVAYDDDGRLSQLSMRTPSEGFSEGIAYDISGRISAVVTLDGHESYTRNGLGHLVEAEISGSRPGQRDRYERDGFGNDTIFHTWAPGFYDDIDEAPGHREANVFPYQRGGRIGYSQGRFKQRYTNGTPAGWFPGFDQHQYEGGDHITEWSEQPVFSYTYGTAWNNLQEIQSATLIARIRSYSHSYYSADRQLRLQQINRDSIAVRSTVEEDTFPSWGAYDEFWYDALGRRILKRTRQEAPVCAFGERCESKIERYVWDGDQLLWEVRQPNATDSNFYDETVGYVQAGGIDAPLGFLKNGTPLVLHRNWQGLFVMATDTLGQNTTCDEGEYPPACTPYSWPGISWNTRNQVVDHKEVQIWYGSLPKGQQDRTGLIYRRNRYYDSGSGQFTQEDPIGIAGGVNLYGYANGDPTTYSDPFGLCPTWAGGDGSNNGFADCTKDQLARAQGAVDDPGALDPVAWLSGGLVGGMRAAGRLFARDKTVSLFRAVSEAEYAQLMENGVFQTSANSLGGKWFARTAADAATWGERMYKGEPFRIVEAKVREGALAGMRQMNYKYDNIGPAVYAELEQLFGAIVRGIR